METNSTQPSATVNSQLASIHEAAKKGDLDRVKSLIKEHAASANSKDENDMSALHYAALGGHASIVELLVAAGAGANERDRHGGTALHLAATVGNPAVAKLLLAAGADTNARDDTGWTALHRACALDRIEFIQALLDGGADVEATVGKSSSAPPEFASLSGKTALNFAASLGKVASVKALIAAGAKDEMRDEIGRTALQVAQSEVQSDFESRKAKALANVDAKIEKAKGLLEKMERLKANPNDMKLLADNEVIEAIAEQYRRAHPGKFPQNPDGSFPPTPIELAVKRHRQVTHNVVSSINHAFAARDARIADIRSGAALVRQKIAEIDALFARWAGLSQAEKDSIPGMIDAIRRGQGMKKEYELQLQHIEQQWRERSRSEALASFANLKAKAGNLANMSGHDRRTLMRTAKHLHQRGEKLLTKEDCAEVAELMTRLRESIGARWWQFWL